MCYRVTTLDYPRPASILSGEGSFLHGGRWNARGSFRAVYGSTTDTTAVAEARANADYAGMPQVLLAPRLLVAIEFDLSRVLDLTAVETMRALELNLEELGREDWRRLQEMGMESATQAFGRALVASGASALVAPSARVAGSVNLVYFPENREMAREARVCEPEKLDRIRGRDQ